MKLKKLYLRSNDNEKMCAHALTIDVPAKADIKLEILNSVKWVKQGEFL